MSKKVFVYIGAHQVSNSITAECIKNSLDIVKKEIDIEIDFFTNAELPLLNCQGCLFCFKKGICPQDLKDNFSILKEKMEEAELLIWGSPVYLHNVSAYMKNFIDRLSYWSHIFKLKNKNGIVLSTSACSGTGPTADYLDKALTCFGCSVIGRVEIINLYDHLDIYCKQCAGLIIKGLTTSAENNSILENQFLGLKQIMKLKEARREESAELEYWKEKKMLEATSFSELLAKEAIL